MLHPPHYDPNQPRVPKGHEGGGRWTRQGESRVQLAFVPPPVWPLAARVIIEGIRAALGLYSLLSLHNSFRRKALIEFDFNARDYEGEGGRIIPKQPTLLEYNDVTNVCRRLPDVQALTDEATRRARADFIKQGRTNVRAADFGTAVHTNLKRLINGDDPNSVKDVNFRAEVSFLKNREENYGRKGSIRIDVYERREDGTVCVYDIKTGKSGLSPRRMDEIAKNVLKVYPEVRRIIVTEVRPTLGPYRTR